jgi:hypothetical protein
MWIQTLLCMTARFAELESILLRSDTPADEVQRSCAELAASGGGVQAPALSPLIEGEWTLLHTSKSSFDPRAPLGARSDGSAPGLESLFPGAKQAVAASSSPIQCATTPCQTHDAPKGLWEHACRNSCSACFG